jgi:hypothetical protein
MIITESPRINNNRLGIWMTQGKIVKLVWFVLIEHKIADAWGQQ